MYYDDGNGDRMIFKLTLIHRSVYKKLFGEYVELIYEFSNLYINSYYHYDDSNGVYYVIDGRRVFTHLNYGEIRDICGKLGFEMSNIFCREHQFGVVVNKHNAKRLDELCKELKRCDDDKPIARSRQKAEWVKENERKQNVSNEFIQQLGLKSTYCDSNDV